MRRLWHRDQAQVCFVCLVARSSYRVTFQAPGTVPRRGAPSTSHTAFPQAPYTGVALRLAWQREKRGWADTRANLCRCACYEPSTRGCTDNSRAVQQKNGSTCLSRAFIAPRSVGREQCVIAFPLEDASVRVALVFEVCTPPFLGRPKRRLRRTHARRGSHLRLLVKPARGKADRGEDRDPGSSLGRPGRYLPGWEWV